MTKDQSREPNLALEVKRTREIPLDQVAGGDDSCHLSTWRLCSGDWSTNCAGTVIFKK